MADVVGLLGAQTSWWELSCRLGLAAFVGAAIGWNRQRSGKAAGLRTHTLVSLGAALFVLVPLSLGVNSLDATSRAIQGVATGIGFLGAGEIVHQSQQPSGRQQTGKIKGLTSAAAIWVTAALGIVIAAGMWRVGLISTLLTLFVLRVGKWFEKFIPSQPDDE